MIKKHSKLIRLFTVFIILTISIAMGGCTIEIAENPKSNSETSGELKIHFLDVGQADSILIQQGSTTMLIDAGNNGDDKTVKDYITGLGIKKIDHLIGTHPHEDHIGGLDYIINSFEIGKIYMPKATATTETFKDVLTAIKNKGMKVTTPVPGDSFKLGDATVTVLGPNGETYSETNDYSIVVKISYGNTAFLLTGDAEHISEKEMITKGFDLKADVLKTGHHGSSSSTSQEFLDKVNPKYAVISAEKGNSYGHPHKETVDKLKAKGIPVYRTDESGTIIATSDGKNISFDKKPGSYTRGTK